MLSITGCKCLKWQTDLPEWNAKFCRLKLRFVEMLCFEGAPFDVGYGIMLVSSPEVLFGIHDVGWPSPSCPLDCRSCMFPVVEPSVVDIRLPPDVDGFLVMGLCTMHHPFVLHLHRVRMGFFFGRLIVVYRFTTPLRRGDG